MIVLHNETGLGIMKMFEITTNYTIINSILELHSNGSIQFENDKDVPTTSHPPSVIQATIITIIPLLMIILNILVFIIVPRLKTLRNSTGYVMISLAATDVSLGWCNAVFLIFMISNKWKYVNSDHWLCIIHGIMSSYLCCVSIVTLAFLNLDRFLTFRLPLHYRHTMTHKRTMFVLLLIWVLVSLYYIPLYLGISGIRVKYYKNIFICILDMKSNFIYILALVIIFNVIPTIVILLTFIGSMKIAFTQKRRILALQIELCNNNYQKPTTDPDQQQSYQPQQQHQQQQQQQQRKNKYRHVCNNLRVVRILLLMTMGYYIFWTPFFIFVCGWSLLGKDTSSQPDLEFAFTWLAASSSFVNPLVYIPCLRTFREEMLSIVLYCYKRATLDHRTPVLSISR